MVQLLMRLFVVIITMIVPLRAFSQLKKDKKAEDYFQKGIRLFEQQNYQQAQRLFTSAASRSYNRLTAASIYMSGLSYYYREEYETALNKFQNLLNSYPLSMYASEASYHKALILLKKPENRFAGLFVLNREIESAQNDEIKQKFLDAYYKFIYQMDSKFLKEYLEFIDQKHPRRTKLNEAYAYKLWEEKKLSELKDFIESFGKENKPLSSKLKLWEPPVIKEKEKLPDLKIAVILPFQASYSVKELNMVSNWAVELLEGIQLAIYNNKLPYDTNIKIKVFDSKNDVSVTQNLMSKEIKNFSPHVIIGDVLNNICLAISDQTEAYKIPQFIPISPAKSLIENKNYTYLQNPSMMTQISGLATYAIKKLGKKNILIFNDQTKLSDIQTKYFQDKGEELKANIIIRKVALSSNFDLRAAKGVISDLGEKGIDGIFIASDDENYVGKLLNAMKSKNIHCSVFGSSDWGKFKIVDKGLLSHFNSSFVDGYYENNDSSEYDKFVKSYRDAFRLYPSRYVCLGYDLVRYILVLKSINPSKSIKEIIHDSKPFVGLIQNYYYGNAQDNQSFQVLQFSKDGKIEKIKMW